MRLLCQQLSERAIRCRRILQLADLAAVLVVAVAAVLAAVPVALGGAAVVVAGVAFWQKRQTATDGLFESGCGEGW